MMQRAMTSDALAPEIMAAWKKLKNVEVDGKTIKLTI